MKGVQIMKQNGLVAEFWNAKESREYAYARGNIKDVRLSAQRMVDAVRELDRLGFFKHRKRMPVF